MSPEYSLDHRGRALEDAFFSDRDRKLVSEMKAAKEKKHALDNLKLVSGIRDDAVIEELYEMKISTESIAALSIVPLVFVAWADGKLDKKERDAVMQSAVVGGITAGSTAEKLLSNWLAKAPASDVIETWENFTKKLCEGFEPATRTALRDEVLGRAYKVAEASGGLLGLTSKVSSEEQYVLARLKKAFA